MNRKEIEREIEARKDEVDTHTTTDSARARNRYKRTKQAKKSVSSHSKQNDMWEEYIRK